MSEVCGEEALSGGRVGDLGHIWVALQAIKD